MAEVTPDTQKRKEGRRSAPAPAPARAPEGAAITGWRTWAVVGVVLVGGVVGWKLIGSSYKGDVETICNAEKNSGFTMQKDMSKVTQYVRAHLETPEGNQLYSALTDAKLLDRAKRLQTEANAQKLGACPSVAAYQQIAAEGEYRSDLQRLCSSMTFPKLGELDDDGRLSKLEEWIDQHARSPRTKELGEPLRQGAAADRAKLLRDSASKMDVFSCDVAKILEGPVLPAKGKGVPMVRPYATPQINGPLDAGDLAKAVVTVTPAMNDCYKKGLEGKADLEGKLAVKLRFDPSGKVGGAAPAEVTVGDRDVVQCIVQALKGMQVPALKGPLVTALLPLELTTAGLAGAPAAASTPAAASASAPGAASAQPSPAASPRGGP
jgi:hypothetical protein